MMTEMCGYRMQNKRRHINIDNELNKTLTELEDKAEVMKEVMDKCIEFADLLRAKDTNVPWEREAAKAMIASIEIALLALKAGMESAIKLGIEAALREERK